MEIDVNKASDIINKIIFFIAFIVFVFLILLVCRILFEISRDVDSNFCISVKCFENFFKYFELVPKIFGFLVAVVGVLLGWLTVQIYLSTYLTTNNNNKNSQLVDRYSTYFEHLKYFNNIVDNYLEQNQIINSRSIDKFIFYEFFFVSPREGDFNISVEYLNCIADINEEIKKLNSALPRKIGYLEHRDLFMELFLRMGIILPKCERSDFFKIEKELFKFISNINKNNGLNPLLEAKYNAYSN